MKIRFAVEYICGYSGGVNQYRMEYCQNEEEAHKRAEELKGKDSEAGLFLLPFLPCYVCYSASHSLQIYWYFSVFFGVSRSFP